MKTRLALAALALSVLGLAYLVRRAEGRRAADRLAALKSDQRDLRQRLETLLAGDPMLSAPSGDVAVGIRSALLEDLMRKVASSYLDRVVLDLSLDVTLRQRQEVKVKTLLGRLKAGTWEAEVRVGRVRGTLRASQPRVEFSGENQVQVGLRVAVEQASGAASVRFSWNAKALANALCRDFRAAVEIQAQALPTEYQVAGALQLSAGEDGLLARPSFPARPPPSASGWS